MKEAAQLPTLSPSKPKSKTSCKKRKKCPTPKLRAVFLSVIVSVRSFWRGINVVYENGISVDELPTDFSMSEINFAKAENLQDRPQKMLRRSVAAVQCRSAWGGGVLYHGFCFPKTICDNVQMAHPWNEASDTVDERNPAPVEVGSLFHYLQGFINPRWFAGFLNHQQYYPSGVYCIVAGSWCCWDLRRIWDPAGNWTVVWGHLSLSRTGGFWVFFLGVKKSFFAG